MKSFITIVIALFSCGLFAANPTFQSFDTNGFVANASANTIRANTNIANPNALVTQSQISGLSSPTNGITQQQLQQSFASRTNRYDGVFTNSKATITLNGDGFLADNTINWDAGGNITIGGSITNSALTASTDLESDANKKLVSLSNAAGVKTNNGSGGIGWTTAPALDLKNSTNAINGPTVSAGSNIGVTRSQNANGSTNTAVSLSDPISLSQANIGTAYATNLMISTNAFAGTTVDFSKPYSVTNLNGSITFSAISNPTSGVDNEAIIVVSASSDSSVIVPASWRCTPNVILSSKTFTVTNGTICKFLFGCQLGLTTNVTALPFQ